MKRFFVCLGLIVAFIFTVLAADLWFMTEYADGMNQRLDAIEKASEFEEKIDRAADLAAYYESNSVYAHRLIPTSRLDEVEMLISRLIVFIKAEEGYEASATTAEIKSRINSLYSTMIYHWYHPRDFGIE